jgi:hypothetical protein
VRETATMGMTNNNPWGMSNDNHLGGPTTAAGNDNYHGEASSPTSTGMYSFILSHYRSYVH